MRKSLIVHIPEESPGKNSTYGVNRAGRVFIKPAARRWSNSAALIIGAAAADQEWEHREGAVYSLEIVVAKNSRFDADAHIALVQDTLTRKLGFDDRLIQLVTCRKDDKWEGPGIKVELSAISDG